MITEEEIRHAAKDSEWSGGTDGWTFNSMQELRDFARAIYKLGQQNPVVPDGSVHIGTWDVEFIDDK